MIGDWKNSYLCSEGNMNPVAITLNTSHSVLYLCSGGYDMIDEDATFYQFGYRSTELSFSSNKRVVAICDDCGISRNVTYQQYRDLCRPCKMKTKEVRRKLSEANMGKRCGEDNHNYGKPLSDETKRKLSEAHIGKKASKETCKKLSEMRKGKPIHSKEYLKKLSERMTGKNSPNYGVPRTEEARRKTSATLQGIAYDEWGGFLKEQPYCSKFNERMKEYIRNKYGRKCFICNKDESDNINKLEKQLKLSVHHIDRNKNQGCDDHDWFLIPVCMSCHSRIHNLSWESRLEYLIKNEAT